MKKASLADFVRMPSAIVLIALEFTCFGAVSGRRRYDSRDQ